MLAQALLDNVSDSVFIIDNEIRFVDLNESACQYLGHSREELIGTRPWESLAWPDEVSIRKYVQTLFSQGTLEGVLPFVLDGGQLSHIEFKAIANISPDQHLVIFRNASNQKRAEEQTQAFLKLGRELSVAKTADDAARTIANVAFDLLGGDACFIDIYLPETDTVDSLLSIDTIDGVRQDVQPSSVGALSPIGRRTLEEGKQLILVEDTNENETLGLFPFGDVDRPSLSMMFVPIRNGRQTVGIFSIQSYTPNAYFYQDLETLQALADYAGAALHRIWSDVQLTRSNRRLVAIREIEQAILEARSSQEIAEAALSRIRDLISYDRGSVILLEAPGYKGRLLAATGLGKDDERITRMLIENAPPSLIENTKNGRYDLVKDMTGSVPEGRANPFQELGLKSRVSVPLIAGNTLFGVLNLASTKINAFNNEDAEVAGEVATSLAVALQNAELLMEANEQANRLSELVDETRRRAEQMEVMVNISAAMRHIQTRQQLIPLILDRLMVLSGAAGAAVALSYGEHLVFELSMGQWPQLAGEKFPSDEGITGTVFTTGSVFVSDDLSQEPEFSGLRFFQVNFAAICVPLGIGDNSLGALWLVRHESFSAEEQRVMIAVADIVANAVRRAVLYERVEEQARQVQQIVDTIPEGMLLLNEERTIVLANPVAQTYLSQLAGVTIGDTLTQLSGQPIEELLRPIVAGENWHELRLEKTGQTFELAVQQTYGRLQGNWVLVIRDVTEERNQARYFQIQERLAVVGQLAAGIAHDFNNIMSVIILYSTMLSRSATLTDKEKERLAVIHKQAERASELIRQILDFSRQSVMKRKALNLRPFLKELASLLERTLPETIHLSLESDLGDLIIQGDPTRLQQAVMNLAVNARDAMPDGGKLMMSLQAKEVRPGDVPPLPDMTPGTWFELKIEDTGMGIKPQDLPHLFEPFFTTKQEGEGTGLGLAQVYGIVKQHDGYIDVSSRIRQGTTFFIYLPAVQMPKVEDVKPDNDPLPMGMGHTILVVEDDYSARMALSEVLEMMDYSVLTASNGKEALERFDEADGAIDLVLSDVVMPTMGGAALYAELKKRQPDIKMVVMTGYPKKEDDWNLLEEGAVFWIQKPFQVSAIIEMIRQALLEELPIDSP